MEEQLDLLCIVSKGGEMGNWSKLQESDFFFFLVVVEMERMARFGIEFERKDYKSFRSIGSEELR